MNDFVFAEFQRNEKLPRYTALRTVDHKYIEVRPGKFGIKRSIIQTLSPLVRSILRQKFFFCLKEGGEKINVARQERRRAKHFQNQMKAILRKNAEMSGGVRKSKREAMDIDQEVSKQLGALGYFD